MKKIHLIRAYDQQKLRNTKGYKILVDRLWPRGVSKADLPYEWWLKELAPSNDLRSWFNHQDDRYDKFKEQYLAEIISNPYRPAILAFLTIVSQTQDLILIYGAKNQEHNQAVVLKEWLEKSLIH
ncbi:MAG TPA: DUF488 family protein [Candidatus Enterococcus stercoravium]|nr:DUF488 family protein [Candidatus Enterococcus stercoravium]